MNARNHAGFTRNELIAVLGVVVLVALVLFPWIRSQVESAVATHMKNESCGVWLAVISANSEREPAGLKSVWPKQLGFDASRTSTEYFRWLMSDSNGVIAADAQYQVCSDLKPEMLSGAGVPAADSAAAFSRANNAWSVLCVGEETASEVPFLVSRNVDLGRQTSTSSPVSLNGEMPFRHRRLVWTTRGGGIFDARAKYLPMLREAMGTNVMDVLRP